MSQASHSTLIKNIPFSTAVELKDLVDFQAGQVVSRTMSAKPHVNITLFAFDKGEEISAHTSPGDAMVQVLDGRARLTIDGREVEAGPGQTVVMPANIPHGVFAAEKMKMLLIVVKQPQQIQGV